MTHCPFCHTALSLRAKETRRCTHLGCGKNIDEKPVVRVKAITSRPPVQLSFEFTA